MVTIGGDVNNTCYIYDVTEDPTAAGGDRVSTLAYQNIPYQRESLSRADIERFQAFGVEDVVRIWVPRYYRPYGNLDVSIYGEVDIGGTRYQIVETFETTSIGDHRIRLLLQRHGNAQA